MTSLPVVGGAEHLTFRCNGCGDCCRRHRVALTHRDLARLLGVVSEPVERLVEWLGPSSIDLDAESASMVELPGGPHLMVLAHGAAGCRFLTADDRCGVYGARPRDCELYPFVLERDERRQPVRLSLFDPARCGDTAATPTDLAALVRADDERRSELDTFHALVRRWNRLARHRRRLRRGNGTAEQFLSFVLGAA